MLKEGMDVCVIDMHNVKPLDTQFVLKYAKKTNGIITAEEHSLIGRLGAAVAETLAEKSIPTKFLRMGIKDKFCESGDPVDLLEKYELNSKHMVKKAKKLLK